MKLHVFIDESGSHFAPSVREDERHYVLAAVTVGEDKLDEVVAGVEKIRFQEAKQGTLKSSKIGNNQERRVRILRAFCTLPLGVHVIAVDKKKVVERYPGYQFKNSFFKHVRSRLLTVLQKNSFHIIVKLDNYGSSEFLEGCVSYLKGKAGNDLFAQREFFFVDDATEVLVQVADVFAGSFRKYCEEGDQGILNAMAPKIITIDWMGRDRAYPVSSEGLEDEEEMAPIIKQVSEKHVYDFMAETLEEDDEVVNAMRQVCSDLMVALLDNPQGYVPGGKLRASIIEGLGLDTFSEEKFKSEVIAGLRDRGVIIATSNKGYKLPSSRKDLVDFSKHVGGMLLPYLRRLRMAREAYQTATSGALDILAGEDLRELRVLIENIAKLRPPEDYEET